MRSSQKTLFNKKSGFIERIDLKIYPEELTLIQSRNGSLYLLDAIRDALITDSNRALKEKNSEMSAGYYVDNSGELAILYPNNKWSWWICFAGEWHFSEPDYPLWNSNMNGYEYLGPL